MTAFVQILVNVTGGLLMVVFRNQLGAFTVWAVYGATGEGMPGRIKAFSVVIGLMGAAVAIVTLADMMWHFSEA